MYWLIGSDGREYGPATLDQLRAWMSEGRANEQSRVRVEGSPTLVPLGSLIGSPRPVQPVPAPATYTSGRTNPLAVTGFIFGMIAITVGWCCCYGIPFNLLGLIFSIVALAQIKNNPSEPGWGLAIAGLILSGLSLVSGFLIGAISGTLMNAHHWAPRIHRL